MRRSTRDPSRPQTWAELRRRVLEEDYLSIAELEQRKRRAHQMKYAIWLIPVGLAGVAPSVIEAGVTWFPLVVLSLISYGVFTSVRLGARWEQRWDELIREKSAPSRRG